MRIAFGYSCATEEYPATILLRRAVEAEKSGFDFITVSDHFQPWFHRGGHACHAWSLISAIGCSTRRIRIGTGVTTPIFRYHPAVIAQAFSTLGELFANRIFLGLGTGEAMNEAPLGFDWPKFDARFTMFKEAVEIIKLIWSGSFVNYDGKYFRLRKANLYVHPVGKVPIYIAAGGKTMAKFAAKAGDAFMTIGYKVNDVGTPLMRSVLDALNEGTDEMGRAYKDIPKMAHFLFSFDEDYDNALRSMSKWRATTVPGIYGTDVHDPREIDEISESVAPEELLKFWPVVTRVDECIKYAEDLIRLGFNEIQFHSASPDEDKFLVEFSKKALPYLKETYKEL